MKLDVTRSRKPRNAVRTGKPSRGQKCSRLLKRKRKHCKLPPLRSKVCRIHLINFVIEI